MARIAVGTLFLTLFVWMAIGQESRGAPGQGETRPSAAEVRLKGKLVLAETVSAIERRKALAKLAQACIAEMLKVEDASLTDYEKSLPIKWTFRKKTPRVRVIGSVPPGECEKALRTCDAAPRLMAKMLSAEMTTWPDLTVVLLTPEDGITFEKNHPERAQWDPAAHRTDWIWQTAHLVQYYKDPNVRLTDAVARVAGTTLSRTWNIIEEQGALYSGLIVWIEARLTGVRRPSYGGAEDNSPDETALHVRLHDDPKLDWMKLSAEAIAAKRAAPLASLLAKHAFKLSATDGLMSWAFASYLLEAVPEKAGRFLQAIENGGVEKAAQAELGLSLSQLDERFRRWVKETAELGPG